MPVPKEITPSIALVFFEVAERVPPDAETSPIMATTLAAFAVIVPPEIEQLPLIAATPDTFPDVPTVTFPPVTSNLPKIPFAVLLFTSSVPPDTLMPSPASPLYPVSFAQITVLPPSMDNEGAETPA